MPKSWPRLRPICIIVFQSLPSKKEKKKVDIILNYGFTVLHFFPKLMLNSSNRVYPPYIFSKTLPSIPSLWPTSMRNTQESKGTTSTSMLSTSYIFFEVYSFYVMNEASNRRVCERNHLTIEKHGWSHRGGIWEVGWRRIWRQSLVVRG